MWCAMAYLRTLDPRGGDEDEDVCQYYADIPPLLTPDEAAAERKLVQLGRGAEGECEFDPSRITPGAVEDYLSHLRAKANAEDKTLQEPRALKCLQDNAYSVTAAVRAVARNKAHFFVPRLPWEEWTSEEMAIFEKMMEAHFVQRKNPKDFTVIARAIKTRTLGETIACFYSWKGSRRYEAWREEIYSKAKRRRARKEYLWMKVRNTGSGAGRKSASFKLVKRSLSAIMGKFAPLIETCVLWEKVPLHCRAAVEAAWKESRQGLPEDRMQEFPGDEKWNLLSRKRKRRVDTALREDVYESEVKRVNGNSAPGTPPLLLSENETSTPDSAQPSLAPGTPPIATTVVAGSWFQNRGLSGNPSRMVWPSPDLPASSNCSSRKLSQGYDPRRTVVVGKLNYGRCSDNLCESESSPWTDEELYDAQVALNGSPKWLEDDPLADEGVPVNDDSDSDFHP